jgi:hypothetical protein
MIKFPTLKWIKQLTLYFRLPVAEKDIFEMTVAPIIEVILLILFYK